MLRVAALASMLISFSGSAALCKPQTVGPAGGLYRSNLQPASPAFNYDGLWQKTVAYPARPDQIALGKPVFSTDGGRIGLIAYNDGSVAVVKSARSALRLPVAAFGIAQNKLLLDVTPKRFEKLALEGGVPVR